MRLSSLFQKENAIAILAALVKKLNVPVSSQTIDTCLHDHPDYPSLLALSDCLSEWKMPNSAYQISKVDYDPTGLSFPLIAHFQESGQFMLISSIINGIVTYTDERKSNKTMSEQAFLSKWSGVVLYPEAGPKSGETTYQTKKFNGFIEGLRIPAVLMIALSGVLYASAQYRMTWSLATLYLITLVGLAATVLLLIHSLNASNPFVQNLCSLGKKNDCNAILKSKEAKITAWLSWTEVGFFYFAGTMFSLLLVAQAIPFLAILNLCCLPYTFWSVWYQYKTKNWCLLCCTVQIILWLQFMVFATGSEYMVPVFQMNTVVGIFFSFAIPMVTWFFVKPFMLKAAQLAPLKQQVKKFKYNAELFNQVLTNQSHFSVPQEIMPIVLGNTAAKHVITMVSNPFCGPCAATHRTLDQWLNTRDDIQVKIVFATANHDDDPKTKVARHLTALSLLGDQRKVEQALNDWYESNNKDYDTWAKNYPMQVNGEMEMVMQRQKEWCKLTEVTFTPTILVNGYKLPDPYLLDDVKYLLS